MHNRIALGTIDGITLNSGHFGQSRTFVIYEREPDGSFQKIEERANPFYENHQHADFEQILPVLQDCGTWIARTMGKGSVVKLQQRGYNPVLVNATTVEHALSEWASST
ncbi:MAG TPA: NifB/NifX family molybdenum-iron cluster-binding protein [Thermotogota bacterium]|nr:NifB/NifX family molybdenum-iron cluster-binding protein [Thermotogota bacterium]HRW92933.1 NifB/NifX family molybdenum-iron cluster-binding protein [Thermotogota bacterium]